MTSPKGILKVPEWRMIIDAIHYLTNPHGGHNSCPLLWPFAKARYRSRYWDYVQRRRVHPVGSWRNPSDPVCHEASTSPDLWPSNKWR